MSGITYTIKTYRRGTPFFIQLLHSRVRIADRLVVASVDIPLNSYGIKDIGHSNGDVYEFVLVERKETHFVSHRVTLPCSENGIEKEYLPVFHNLYDWVVHFKPLDDLENLLTWWGL